MKVWIIRTICALAYLIPLALAENAAWSPNIEYGKAGGESLLLDASVPQGEGPFPIAILIHGGGWGSGDKSQDFAALSKPLTEAGFVWFSINYRLAPRYRWPACFADVRSAIHWVRTHATEYKGDPRRIALIGYSAGGQLAAMAAIDENTGVQAVVGLAPAVELTLDSQRRGHVSPALRGLLDLPEPLNGEALARIAEISPGNKIRAGLPPFLLVQGTVDHSVLHTDTIAFSERLKQMKVPCEVLALEGAPHRITDWPKFSLDYPTRIVTWLRASLGSASPPRSSS